MAESYHLVTSEHSCVGCHQQETEHKDCAGCHFQLTQSQGQRACLICHNGPVPGPEPGELPAVQLTEVVLAPLPAPSADQFPENVVIDLLSKEYEPSKLPHAKIVARLDTAVRQSKLAARFHTTTEMLCSGCHHHSPAGTRPPPCRSCHEEEADATTDRPGLKTAYHRQCLGCHQQMMLEQQSCTDCHAAKEVVP
jgi:hypothetical protein